MEYKKPKKTPVKVKNTPAVNVKKTAEKNPVENISSPFAARPAGLIKMLFSIFRAFDFSKSSLFDKNIKIVHNIWAVKREGRKIKNNLFFVLST